jgi:hypothetical protein
VSNSVVSVTPISGWSKDSSSTATELDLNGPDGLNASFATSQVPTSVTLSDVINEEEQGFEGSSSLTNVSVCGQPASAHVPGSPSVAGVGATVCFTATSQGGNDVEYAALIFNGLLKSTSGTNQLLLSEIAVVPQSDSETVLEQELKPVLQSAHWLQVSSS